MNVAMLKSRMVLYGDTQRSLANVLKLSLSQFNSKLNEARGAQFTLTEIQTLAERYQLTPEELNAIFFAPKDDF